MAEERRKFHPNDLMPNTTQVPNVFLDRVMPVASEAVFKLLMCVARQTYGWRKEWDAISISQLERLSGLSNRSVIDSMAVLRDAGLVYRRNGEKAEYGMEYALNLSCDFEKAVAFLQQQRKQREPRKQPSGGRKKSKEGHEPGSQEAMNPVQGHEPLAGGTGFMGSDEPGSPEPMNEVHTQKSTIKINYQNQRGKQPAPASQMALSPNVAAIAEDRRAQRLKGFMSRIGSDWRSAESRMEPENKRRALYEHVQNAAKMEGMELTQAKQFLLDHPAWKHWPDLNDLDSQQEIDFPAPAKPAARWDEAAYVAAQKGDVSAPAQQLFFSFREFLRGQLGESEYRRLVQPLKFCCLTATEMHVLCPEGWNGNGEKLRQQISAWLPERLQGIRFLTAELNHRGHEGTQRKTGSE